MPKTANVPVINDGITSVVNIEEKVDNQPRVRIMLPMPPEAESGMKVDPYEHVTINGEKPVYVKRGEYVDVTVPVFLQLRNKYPNI
jgi:hypothetical protein